jgi:ubiquinone/menaquinone biosynthesis C-methylase UbiE
MDQRDLSAHQFGEMASNYLSSSVHATGADLDRLSQIAQQRRPARALDLGCGAGHVSFALARAGVSSITAYDLAAPMLAVVEREAATRGYRSIETRRGPAEQLPFDHGSFELIVTRFSAHHWSSVPAALKEITRVLTHGGRLIVIDVVAPESALLDTVLQALELMRDISHVRNYRLSEWRRMLHENGLNATAPDTWKLSLEFSSWVRRIGTPDARVQALRAVMADLPAEAREYFAIGADRSFNIDSAWIESVKRP